MSAVIQLLTSKTNVGLYVILAFSGVLVYFHQLTPEAVDLIKWVGGSFFLVRSAANVSENLNAGAAK